MIIYLTGGQTIDMGDVKYAIDSCGREFKAFKYANDGDDVISTMDLSNDDTLVFYNTNNEMLELKNSEIVGIRGEVE